MKTLIPRKWRRFFNNKTEFHILNEAISAYFTEWIIHEQEVVTSFYGKNYLPRISGITELKEKKKPLKRGILIAQSERLFL